MRLDGPGGILDYPLRMFDERVMRQVIRIPGAQALWRRFPIGSIDTRVRYGIFTKPQYAYGVYAAADQAKRLGLRALSVVELGVAGGRGLLALEQIARAVAERFDMSVHVVGFDSGSGMPAPVDFRDLPHVWGRGFYRMDVDALTARLSSSTKLILGSVADTIGEWTPAAPLGFVAFDLDYYSSTKAALRVFEHPEPSTRLPRCYCYFDDVMWPEHACHNEYTGELCAIREFNEEHAFEKICPIHMFGNTRALHEPWNEAMYVLHDFKHPLYCTNITAAGDEHTQLAL
jgi:hypothetical protein